MNNDSLLLGAVLLIQLNALLTLGFFTTDIRRWIQKRREAKRRVAEGQNKRGAQ